VGCAKLVLVIIGGARLQNVVKPSACFLPTVVLSTREAAWQSREWDTAIRLSSFLILRAGSVSALDEHTSIQAERGQRDTYPVCHIQIPARPCWINRSASPSVKGRSYRQPVAFWSLAPPKTFEDLSFVIPLRLPACA
jgi:hypothetical protein